MRPNDISGAIEWFFDDAAGHLTDRDYSWATTDCVYHCPSNKYIRGYTTYEPYYCPPLSGVIPTSPWVSFEGGTPYVDDIKRIRHPTVQCAIVPVDVLEFRDQAFYTCIMQRINYNFNAWIAAGYPNPDFWNPPCKTRFWETDSVAQCPVKMSIQQCCHTIIKDVVPANFVKLRTCEGLMQTRRDNEELQEFLTGDPESDLTYLTEGGCPPGFPGCSTTYTDGTPYQMVDGTGWTQNYLRQLTQKVNEDQCFETEPEDYMFKTYFGDFWYPEPDELDPEAYTWEFVGYHMPYMRWWDTGASAGNPTHGGNYLNTLGSFDTLIGVGREERDYQTAQEMADEEIEGSLAWFNEFYGVNVTDEGGNLESRMSIEQPSEMGRIGGWMELKAHQMWSIRRSNLFCVGRYEKLFKHGGPEDLALSKAGSGYTSMVYKPWPWAMGWRGYVTDDHDAGWQYKFPHFPFGAAGASIIYGLDNALPGDIIVYNINGLSQVAYVTDIGFDVPNFKDAEFNYLAEKHFLGGQPLTPNRVFVVSWDQHKFPTSTGSSINWGVGPERTIYKNRVPSNYSSYVCSRWFRAVTDPVPDQFDCRTGFEEGQCSSFDCQPSCEDPDYSACVLPNNEVDWNNAMIYRPRRMTSPNTYADIRACNGYISYPPDTDFNLGDTYSWTGWSGDPDNPLPPIASVIYQNQTHLVGTDLWGYCANSGWDPPPHFSKEYKGARTGAITDATLCGPRWWSCSARPGAEVKMFPEGQP